MAIFLILALKAKFSKRVTGAKSPWKRLLAGQAQREGGQASGGSGRPGSPGARLRTETGDR